MTVLASPGGPARRPSREISVEDLLLHTSGLSHRTSEVYRKAQVRSRAESLPRFIDNIVRVPLMEDPGTAYRYSESPTVLGRLVEIWSGKPFEVFLERARLQAARHGRYGFLGCACRPRTSGHRVHAGAGRWPRAIRDRSRSVHRTSGAHRRCGRTRLDGPRLPSVQPDAAQQRNAGWSSAVARGHGREDDGQRVAGRDPRCPRRRDGMGSRERQCRPESRRRSPIRQAAGSTGGTAAPVRSSGSIRRRR